MQSAAALSANARTAVIASSLVSPYAITPGITATPAQIVAAVQLQLQLHLPVAVP